MAVEVVDQRPDRELLPVGVGRQLAGLLAQPVEAEAGADTEVHRGHATDRSAGDGGQPDHVAGGRQHVQRSEEQTSELQALMSNSEAGVCWKKKKKKTKKTEREEEYKRSSKRHGEDKRTER